VPKVYVAAAAVAHAHGGTSALTIIVGIAAFVGIVAATVAATVLLQEPIQMMAARLFGGFGPLRGPNLRGLWYSSYSFVSSRTRQRTDTTQLMLIRQFGPYVVGKCLWSSGAHRHFITGRTQGHILTGRWRNVAEGAKHHGVLQLLIDPDGTHLHGKWLGYDARNHIQHADWEFTLAARDYKADRETLIAIAAANAGPPATGDPPVHSSLQ
jgi:hypothetical protein